MSIDQHVMIDIETLGTEPGSSAILQIGAVEFSLDEFCPIRDFQTTVKVDYQSIDAETLRWWLKTNPLKLAALMNDPGALDEDEAFDRLHGWLPVRTWLWAKPTTFDCCFVQEQLKHIDSKHKPVPEKTSFRRTIDLRSYLLGAGVPPFRLNYKPDVVRGMNLEVLSSDVHDALFDCHAQLQTLRDLLRNNK